MRAFPVGDRYRHRGMDAEFSGFVGTGAYDAAALRIPAHDHGLAFELRTVALFHRREERVHIDVDEFSGPLHISRKW